MRRSPLFALAHHLSRTSLCLAQNHHGRHPQRTSLSPVLTTTTYTMAPNVESATDWEGMWSRGIQRGDYFDAMVPLPYFSSSVKSDSLLTERAGVALVPGCGRGYDVELLSRSGLFSTVYGMELSTTAAQTARDYLSSVTPPLPANWRVLQADFFADDPALQARVDLVYDYTFFCAIQPASRIAWAKRMAALIKPGGTLVTVMFPCIEKAPDDGPPFAVSNDAYKAVLVDYFKQLDDGPRPLTEGQAHEGREGITMWCKWERLDN